MDELIFLCRAKFRFLESVSDTKIIVIVKKLTKFWNVLLLL